MNMNDTLEPAEVTNAQPMAVQVSQPVSIVQIALQQGAGLDVIERLWALSIAEQARVAEKQYNDAFAAFKAHAVHIIKNKTVDLGPLKGKKYAELFAVVNAVTPALSEHGLSASWKLTKDERDWIEVTCVLKHTGGHSECVSMGGPPDAGGAKNAIQARASTVSYLERYTLKAILGVSEQDEDVDGNGDELRSEWIQRAMEAETSADLDRVVKQGVAALNAAKDADGYTAFQRAVLHRREDFKS